MLASTLAREPLATLLRPLLTLLVAPALDSGSAARLLALGLLAAALGSVLLAAARDDAHFALTAEAALPVAG